MQFYDYYTEYQKVKRQTKVSVEHFQEAALYERDRSRLVKIVMEDAWGKVGRPYYNLYPSVIPMFVGLKFQDMQTNRIKLPTDALVIRMATNHSSGISLMVENRAWPLATVFVSKIENALLTISEFVSPVDYKDRITSVRSIHIGGDRLIEAELAEYVKPQGTTMGDRVPGYEGLPSDIEADILRIVVTLGLIADNPDLIRPDYLAKDRDKVMGIEDPAALQKFIDRAAARHHGIGYVVGEGIESVPHMRRGHLHLYWTGKGRKIPKVNWVKETLVHREKISEVPTGYFDEQAFLDGVPDSEKRLLASIAPPKDTVEMISA